MERGAPATFVADAVERRVMAVDDVVGRLRRDDLFDGDGDFVSGNLLPPRHGDAAEPRPDRPSDHAPIDALSGRRGVPLHADCRDLIRRSGFDLVAVTPAVDSNGIANLVRWIELGYAAEMDYFARRIHAYEHPRGVLPGCRSLVVMTLPYDGDPPAGPREGDRRVAGHGRVARYAWSGLDYHDVVHRRLRPMRRLIADRHSGATSRVVVDTAPLLEREVAAAAGIGWRGKNTLLLNKSRGSYFLLACVLIDAELSPELPLMPFAAADPAGHCGTCTACLDACPTDAFAAPGVLDAGRCISYLTIEHRGSIERDLRSSIGDWIFGCDVCQEVCPWNRGGSPPPDVGLTGSLRTIDAVGVFEMDDEEFRQRFRPTALWRPRRRGLLRNAAIVIGNTNPPGGEKALRVGMATDDPVIREAAAWAWGRIRPTGGLDALRMWLTAETDPMVVTELTLAIEQWTVAIQPPAR